MRRLTVAAAVLVVVGGVVIASGAPAPYALVASPTQGTPTTPFRLTYTAGGRCGPTGTTVAFSWDAPYPSGVLLDREAATTANGDCVSSSKALVPPQGHDGHGPHHLYGEETAVDGAPEPATQATTTYSVEVPSPSPSPRPSSTPCPSAVPTSASPSPSPTRSSQGTCGSPSPAAAPAPRPRSPRPCVPDPDFPDLCRGGHGAILPSPVGPAPPTQAADRAPPHQDQTALTLVLVLLAMFVVGAGALLSALALHRRSPASEPD